MTKKVEEKRMLLKWLGQNNPVILYRIFIGIGCLSLFVALILETFAKQIEIFDFLIGMLEGLSIVMNLSGLVLYRKNIKERNPITASY